jgi:hypothetical protein
MMIRKTAFFALVFSWASISTADVTKTDIDGALDRNMLRHPYLYFSESDKPSIAERIKNDPACRDIMARMKAEANRLLYTPVDTVPPERPKEQVYDNTWPRESYILNNAEWGYNLAFVYQMTGEKKYAEKAVEFLDVVCDQPTWVHGYHEFPVFYDRVWPWGARDDEVVFGYAQWSDHVVFRLAAAYDWLYPVLDKRNRDRLRGALLEKAILRVRGNYEYHWWATAYRCNWCVVCNSSLGVAALALLTEDPGLTDVVAESLNRVSKTLDQIGDGGWQEGISYLNYTVNESLNFAEALKRVTGGKYNLYKHPGIESAINTFLYCQILPDKTVHFSDCAGSKTETYSLLNQIMTETGNKKASWLRKYRTDEQPGGFMDILKPKSAFEPEIPKETSMHFRSVDWVIMRSDFFDPEKVVVACKSGLNNDPHHGHLDQGHFSVYWRGEEFICDNGSAVQDKAYFYQDRWDYPLASSIGHNVVLVSGEKQIPGKLKNIPWDETIGGKVLAFRPGKDRDYALLDPSNAYPKKELKSWRRHIILEKPIITVALDEVTCAKGAEIEARFHSAAAFDIRDGFVILKSGNNQMALIPVTGGTFTLRPGKHAIMAAEKNARFYWVPYVGVVMKAPGEKNLLGTIILPVEGVDEARAVAHSATLTVDTNSGCTLSFIKAGKTIAYRFRKSTEGLELE